MRSIRAIIVMLILFMVSGCGGGIIAPGWYCADGTVYDPVAEPNPANVSRNTDLPYTNPCLALDSSGNPHIAWRIDSYENREILYVHWNGSDWVSADGTVYNTVAEPNPANVSGKRGTSWQPSLALDSLGNPHIAWEDWGFGKYNHEILYVHWNGSNWVCADDSVYDPSKGNANVSRNSGRSHHPALAIDSSGNPHIAWEDDVSYGWENDVSYGIDQIFYTHWNGSDWVCADGSVYDPLTGNANVSRNSDKSYCTFLALDSSDNPHIAWSDWSYGNIEIIYTRLNGSDWVCADGSVYDPLTGNANLSRNSDESSNPFLAIDSSGNPHIAWHDESYESDDMLYTHWNGNDWVCADGTVFDPVADPNPANVSWSNGSYGKHSLALDSSGNPHIAWYDWNYHDILYIRWNSSDWVCVDGTLYDSVIGNSNVSSNGNSFNLSFALDSSGYPHISWEDESYENEVIYYIHWDQ
jgi:hypothetical protein